MIPADSAGCMAAFQFGAAAGLVLASAGFAKQNAARVRIANPSPFALLYFDYHHGGVVLEFVGFNKAVQP
jgi:hypothetical protein